jgi:acyl-CoA reductase-like NAD-dependent aldehyde dehydrogenase
MSTITSAIDVDVPGLDKLYIGGEWAQPSSSRTIDVVMPSTGEVVATVASAAPADADAAVAAARQAFDEGSWPRLTHLERAGYIRRWTEELAALSDEFSKVWTYESGYPQAHGDLINKTMAPLIWDNLLAQASEVPWEERRTTAASDVLIQRLPIGTVLGILPYNGPLANVAMKIMPALLTGCTVIVKVAPDSQLTARLMGQSLDAVGFPPGVISVLAADTETSQYLVAHRGIDMVHMTGGTAVAVEVVKNTADRLARTGLELGGKSPAIITDDADLDKVMTTLVPGAIGVNGQVCAALTRILVSRTRYEEVVTRLAEEFSKLKVGDPFDPSTDLGPLANERALERTERMLAKAIDEGAKVAYGGQRPPELPRGFYFEPTLLRDVTDDMEIAQEEVFGPIIAVMAYEDVDDAVRIANGTKYGLAGSVYAKDNSTALEIAKRIVSGTVAVNVFGVSLTEPYGGVKSSGWGRECGTEGILEFTNIKSILLNGED